MTTNRAQRRSWDKYVSEARKVSATVDLGNEEIVVYVPSSAQMKQLGEASETDIWAQLRAILGTENAEKLEAVAGDAPITAIQALLSDILSDLGLADLPNS